MGAGVCKTVKGQIVRSFGLIICNVIDITFSNYKFLKYKELILLQRMNIWIGSHFCFAFPLILGS